MPTELRTDTLTEIPGYKVNESASDLRVESAIESVDESLIDMPIDSPTELAADLPSEFTGELPSAGLSPMWRGVQRRVGRFDGRRFERGLAGRNA